MHGGNFEPRAFAAWCQDRWRFCALAMLVAAGVTLAVSLTLTKQFTATSTVLIGAPGGNDPRATVAMNNVYLDSLKAWERVASSDFLFARALEAVRAGGTEPAGPVASLKRKILRVAKPAGMALLEISITLPDAKKAQKMAQIMAEQTVAQSNFSDDKSAADFSGLFQEDHNAAARRVASALKARDDLTRASSVELLENEVTAAAELNGRLQTETALARAELTAQRVKGSAGETAGTEARLASLEKQQREAAGHMAAAAARLESAKNRSDVAEAELKSARAALDAADLRANEAISGARWRGERLRLVDPGATPQEPSSPNIPLNVLAALAVSLGGSILYLALTFGLRRDATGNRTERLYSVR
jgi:capsular polysaccharide biosynthesis protein